MSNKFYNPKNQYNELLASVPYVNAEDAAVDAKFTSEINRVDERINTEIEDREAADQNIHHKIETLNTIKVKWINADRGDNKCSNIEDYFVSLIEPSSTFHISEEELKVELGQTIYIIEGKDDVETYEEWICLYPDFTQHHVNYNGCKIPVMVRLGAVDSILAREDSPGSVQLIHNLYNEEDWSKYFATDYEGNVTHRPIKGEAVAPCALKAFVEADKEIIGSLELEITARKDAIAAEEVARSEENTAIKARLDKIEAEIEGSTVEEEIGFQDSRLDRIEAAIGMNHHHCDNCGCEHTHCTCNDDKCSCSDAKDKCTIYCRLNDIEGDLEEHMNILESHNGRIENLETLTEGHSTEIENLKVENDDLDERIGNAEKNIESNNQYIQTIESRLNEEKDRIETESLVRETSDNAIWSEIGEKTNAADGTIWKEIKEIQEEIGNQDEPYEDSIWIRIKNNKIVLDSEIARSTAADREQVTRISALENGVEKITDEIGNKLSTDINIWHGIHTEINDRESADSQLSKDIENALSSAKAYADELKTAALSEAAVDAKNKAEAAQNAAINSAAEDATDKANKAIAESKDYAESYTDDAVGDLAFNLRTEMNAAVNAAANDAAIKANDAKLEAKNYAESYTDNAVGDLTLILRTEMNALGVTCKEYADELKTAALLEAANDAKNKADAAINAAANDAADKAAGAKLEAITTATENARNYTDQSINSVTTTCNTYTDNKVGDLSREVSIDINNAKLEATTIAAADATNKVAAAIADAKNELNTAINSKVNLSDFENITSSIETQLSSKVSESDLSSTNLKVENLENNLENLSHEFHYLNSQTQFAVRTSLPGNGSKVIQVYNLIGPASNEWDLVAITAVIANNNTIYPEIIYSGDIGEGKNDNRTVSITFEHGGTENLPVTLIVSALKAIEEHIIEID